MLNSSGFLLAVCISLTANSVNVSAMTFYYIVITYLNMYFTLGIRPFTSYITDWLELHELQVSLVVSQDGGKLKIPGSNISLDIPPGAMQEKREIQMKIIPHCLDPGGDPISFSSNSSVVVELLPNKLQFQKTVHLRLPHCLHLNDKYNSLKDAKVLISHHDKGKRKNISLMHKLV